MGKIYIIGAGMAGLSAAFHACLAGLSPVVLEASPHVGGRAGAYDEPHLSRRIDRSQHLIVSANSHVLRIVRALKLEHNFAELSYVLRTSGGTDLFLPPFWNFFKGGREASDLLCRSVMNTDPKDADKRLLFKTVLSCLFGGYRPFVAKKSLEHDLFLPMFSFITSNGGEIRLSSKVLSFDKKAINMQSGKIDLSSADRVIVAADPVMAARILGVPCPFSFGEITNVHYFTPHVLAHPMIGMPGRTSHFLFQKDGYVSVTVSDSAHLKGDGIPGMVWGEIAGAFSLPDILPPFRMIREVRATPVQNRLFRDLKRRFITERKDVFLAGDYVQWNSPCTLEGAARSGHDILKKVKETLS